MYTIFSTTRFKKLGVNLNGIQDYENYYFNTTCKKQLG